MTRKRPAITGLGSTDFGVFPGQTAYTLGSTALRQAMAEASVRPKDIDGLIVTRIPDYQRMAELHGLNPRLALNLPGQGRMAGVALQLASQAIESGHCETVALVYGNDGKSAGATYGGGSDGYGSGGAGLWFPYGMTSPGAVHGMMLREWEHRWGPAGQALAKIAVTTRAHAALNPRAVMRNLITEDDYFAARYIAAPLRLLDYCLINDGGIALILRRAELATEGARRPVYVSGVSTATQLADSTTPPPDQWFAPIQQVARSLREQSGLSPADMDALMVYDNFTPTVLFSLEGMGLCGRGEAARWVLDNDIGLGGPHPINTSGGHLSESYMQGWGLLAEAVRQIRGEAFGRQVRDARHIQYACASPICAGAVLTCEAA